MRCPHLLPHSLSNFDGESPLRSACARDCSSFSNESVRQKVEREFFILISVLYSMNIDLMTFHFRYSVGLLLGLLTAMYHVTTSKNLRCFELLTLAFFNKKCTFLTPRKS